MCGIIGFVNATGYGLNGTQKSRFIQQGLIVNTLRGDDGAGVFYMGKTTPGWAKIAADGYSLTIHNVFIDSRNDIDASWFCAAHNRAATVGKLTSGNTHPFSEGPITMVHNGTLTGDGGLRKKQTALGVEVDSHALCHNLAEVGPAEAPDMLGEVRGAFALAWYDTRDESFNLARNSQRPLHVYSSNQKGTFFFASEAEMLDLLIARMRISDPAEKKALPVGEIWKFKKNVATPEVVAFKPFQETYSYNGYGGYGTGRHHGWDDADWFAGGDGWLPGGRRSKQEVKPTPPKEKDKGAKQEEAAGMCTRAILSAFKLDPTDTLLVKPLTRADYTSPAGVAASCVVAHCTTLDRPVLVRGLSKRVIDNMWDSVWQVNPVGVFHVTNKEGKEVPAVIGRYTGIRGLNLRGGQFEQIKSLYTQMDSAKSWVLYKGPNNTSLTHNAILEYVKGGCQWCGKEIKGSDLRKITWFGEEPVCHVCSDGYMHAVTKVQSGSITE